MDTEKGDHTSHQGQTMTITKTLYRYRQYWCYRCEKSLLAYGEGPDLVACECNASLPPNKTVDQRVTQVTTVEDLLAPNPAAR